MKIYNLPLLFVVLYFFCFSVIAGQAQPRTANGALFTVDNTGDSVDINPGDGVCADENGQCTLRAAINEANSNSNTDVIIFSLPNPSVINLTLGQLSITNDVIIIGTGARSLTIQRNFSPGTPTFRIFFIAGNEAAEVFIHRLKISNGNAGTDQYGGGVYISSQNTVYLNNVNIANNSAGYGGGIANFGKLGLIRSTVNSNTATLEGGALVNRDTAANTTITNSTITENTSANICGAICNNSASLFLVNNTISHNTASENASGVGNFNGGTVGVLNTIIGNNTISTAVKTLSGSFTSYGNNIITDARDSSGFTNGVQNDQVSDNNIINPLLGPLANNGGQTDTRALQNGSPAINAGSNCVLEINCSRPSGSFPIYFRNDQRINYARLAGDVIDVGAFESEASLNNGFGFFGGRLFGPPYRFSNILVVLINTETAEKLYKSLNPFTSFRFDRLATDVIYVFQVKSKRATPVNSLKVIDSFDLPNYNTFSPNKNDFKVIENYLKPE